LKYQRFPFPLRIAPGISFRAVQYLIEDSGKPVSFASCGTVTTFRRSIAENKGCGFTQPIKALEEIELL
jgi:hypothetical protein